MHAGVAVAQHEWSRSRFVKTPRWRGIGRVCYGGGTDGYSDRAISTCRHSKRTGDKRTGDTIESTEVPSVDRGRPAVADYTTRASPPCDAHRP